MVSVGTTWRSAEFCLVSVCFDLSQWLGVGFGLAQCFCAVESCLLSGRPFCCRAFRCLDRWGCLRDMGVRSAGHLSVVVLLALLMYFMPSESVHHAVRLVGAFSKLTARSPELFCRRTVVVPFSGSIFWIFWWLWIFERYGFV